MSILGRVTLLIFAGLLTAPAIGEFIFPASVTIRGAGWRLGIVSTELVKCGVRIERTGRQPVKAVIQITVFAINPNAIDGDVYLNKCGEQVLSRHKRKISIVRRRAQYD